MSDGGVRRLARRNTHTHTSRRQKQYPDGPPSSTATIVTRERDGWVNNSIPPSLPYSTTPAITSYRSRSSGASFGSSYLKSTSFPNIPHIRLLPLSISRIRIPFSGGFVCVCVSRLVNRLLRHLSAEKLEPGVYIDNAAVIVVTAAVSAAAVVAGAIALA